MRILLDTHALLWALFEPEKLGIRAVEALESIESEVFTSSVNFFEISQKVRIGKLPLEDELVRTLPAICLQQRWKNLDLTPEYAISAGLYASQHRDPFDRLLAFQAKHEALVLVTKDTALEAFPIKTLW